MAPPRFVAARSAFGFGLALALVLAGAACSDASGGGGRRGGGGGRGNDAPGVLAQDYVSQDEFTSMLVEVDFFEGAAPDLAALEAVIETFERRLSKPDGVTLAISDEIPAGEGKDRYEVGDILSLEGKYRQNRTDDVQNPGRAVLYLLYLNGASEFDKDGSRALGLAYEADGIAVFKENIVRTTPSIARMTVERMVVVHEGGHIFGLVDNGTPMVTDHEDPKHKKHDVSEDCVMYFKIETGDVQTLLTNPPVDYDFACRMDLFAAGGPDPNQ